MQIQTFAADSAADAVAMIRARLGPGAVVLNVRKLPPEGLSRLWQKPRIEVTACLPVETAPAENGSEADSLAELRQELARLRQRMDDRSPEPAPAFDRPAPEQFTEAPPWAARPEPAVQAGSRAVKPEPARADIAGLLENTGLHPVQARRLEEKLRSSSRDIDSLSFQQQTELVRAVLKRVWKPAPPILDDTMRPHVLIGPAGSGKTTCLCKWLTQLVLVEGKPARVWRLDGQTANMAESLSVYGEILGMQVERHWRVGEEAVDLRNAFIDLPGIDWRNAGAIAHLKQQLDDFLSPHVHLVLNAAYELPVLLAQVKAFGDLPVTDLIFTHLDEEPRWGKLWNFALGTKYPIRFLSSGQNIPGDFHSASPEQLLLRQFPPK